MLIRTKWRFWTSWRHFGWTLWRNQLLCLMQLLFIYFFVVILSPQSSSQGDTTLSWPSDGRILHALYSCIMLLCFLVILPLNQTVPSPSPNPNDLPRKTTQNQTHRLTSQSKCHEDVMSYYNYLTEPYASLFCQCEQYDNSSIIFP